MTLIDYNAELCEEKASFKQAFLESLIQGILKAANATLGCPYKKGIYNFENLDIQETSIPSFLRRNMRISNTIILNAKTEKRKAEFSFLNIKMIWNLD